MNDKVTFYYNPMSRGRVAHWMLEEVGADYEFKILDWKKNDHKSPEYLQINPMGKIPSIVHRGVTVTETAAICAYLADAFPQANMAPAVNDPQRGAYYRWLFFTVNCLETAVADRNNPPAKASPSSQLGYGSYEDTMKTLEGAISNGFVVGGRFSAVDVYLSSVLGWYMFQKMIEPTPVIQKYVQLCSDRPAYKRFMDKAEQLMKQ